MNSKDGWFLGILALAYIYLDLIPTSDSGGGERRAIPSGEGEPRPARRVLDDATSMPVCPRHDLHLVTIREDGAIWCHPCDEAFYPSGAIWQSLATSAN